MLASLITAVCTATLLGITKSKGAKQASDEFSVAVWNSVKPYLIKEDEKATDKIEDNPDDPKSQILLEHNLEKIIENNPELQKELEEMFKSEQGQNIIQNLEGDENTISQTTKSNQINKIDGIKGNKNNITQG